MNNCKDCLHWRLKDAGPMAAHAYGRCAKSPAYQYRGPNSSCNLFAPAPSGVSQARAKWLTHKGIK